MRAMRESSIHRTSFNNEEKMRARDNKLQIRQLHMKLRELAGFGIDNTLVIIIRMLGADVELIIVISKLQLDGDL